MDVWWSNGWALLLVVLPVATVLGNSLVIFSVVSERSLQTSTNLLIVSLACADLLVGLLVMPWGIYLLVEGGWRLPSVLCDLYISMDVVCSTASIFNLVAISIDRFQAVKLPLRYSRKQSLSQRGSRSMLRKIVSIWLISLVVGLPILMGMNKREESEEDEDECKFHNPLFIIVSSVVSFFMPCTLILILYFQIIRAIVKHDREKALKRRALPQLKAIRTKDEECRPTIVQSPTAAVVARASGPAHAVPSTAAGGVALTLGHIIKMSTDPLESCDFEKKAERTTPSSSFQPHDRNSDGDHLYDEYDEEAVSSGTIRRKGMSRHSLRVVLREATEPSRSESFKRHRSMSSMPCLTRTRRRRRGGKRQANAEETKKGVSFEMATMSRALPKSSSLVSTAKSDAMAKRPSLATSVKVLRKAAAWKMRSQQKLQAKRERRERKATKTLGIVLGCFLFCWLPFFVVNVLSALDLLLLESPLWRPSMTLFLVTTWLGYLNSALNPIIYTLFNQEFRKTFKRILCNLCLNNDNYPDNRPI